MLQKEVLDKSIMVFYIFNKNLQAMNLNNEVAIKE